MKFMQVGSVFFSCVILNPALNGLMMGSAFTVLRGEQDVRQVDPYASFYF